MFLDIPCGDCIGKQAIWASKGHHDTMPLEIITEAFLLGILYPQ